MSECQENGYENEVRRFIHFTEEAGIEGRPHDLGDCLWRRGYPADDDALLHEITRMGLDAAAWRGAESLRAGWVEVLTSLHFPDEAVPETEGNAAALQLLQGLVAAFQRAGEPLESARTRAVMALHDLVQYPGRYEAVRGQAGLKAGADTGEEARSDASPSDLPAIPWCKPETESPGSDVPPLVPEDLYFELDGEPVVLPVRAEALAKVSETSIIAPAATAPPPPQHHQDESHDSWLHRNLRFKNES